MARTGRSYAGESMVPSSRRHTSSLSRWFRIDGPEYSGHTSIFSKQHLLVPVGSLLFGLTHLPHTACGCLRRSQSHLRLRPLAAACVALGCEVGALYRWKGGCAESHPLHTPRVLHHHLPLYQSPPSLSHPLSPLCPPAYSFGVGRRNIRWRG